jgi:hypothetical protein
VGGFADRWLRRIPTSSVLIGSGGGPRNAREFLALYRRFSAITDLLEMVARRDEP